MSADILAIGYLAVLDRLAVNSLPRGVGDGASGFRLETSLTGDASLVAMHLWENEVPAALAVSHPGTGGEAALPFLRERLRRVVVGPNFGPPLELEATDREGRRIWLNYPRPGVRSLAEMCVPPEVAAGTDLVYVDSYPWLADAAITACRRLTNRDRLLYVNIGEVSRLEFESLARRWLDLWPPGQTVLQVSMPSLTDRDECNLTLAQLGSCGAQYTIVTSGERGLGIKCGSESAWIEAQEIPDPVETSGAGAAVAAAFIRRIRLGGIRQLLDLGIELVAAGGRQCTIDGGLPARARLEWLGQ